MMGDTLIMNIGIYLRKSRGEDEVQDLEKHREYLLRIAEQKGWNVTEYAEIASSQDWLERPELQRMLKDIQDRTIDSILVYAPDRLSRKDVHFLTIIDHLLKYGINKIYIKESEYDLTSPHTRTQLAMMAVLAQAEYMLIAQRLTEGKMRSAEKGKWNGGRVKYGYMSNESKQLVINPDEYPVAREIVDKMLQGFSFHAIAKDFNERGLRTRRNKAWTTANLHDFIESPTLRGHLMYTIKGKEIFSADTHQALMSEAEFQTIKRIQANRSNNFKKKKNDVSHWLSGLLTCSVCGWSKKVQIDTKKTGNYHIRKCKSKIEVDEQYIDCYCIGCKTDVVEEMIKETVLSIREQLQESMKHLSDTNITVLKAKQSQAVKQLEKELNKLTTKEDNLLELLSDMVISREDYQAQKKRQEEQKGLITKQLREAQQQLKEIDISASYNQLQYCETLISRWDTLEHEDKNRLIKMLFSRIEYLRTARNVLPTIKVFPL
jgi:site-specific DNA recombinase